MNCNVVNRIFCNVQKSKKNSVYASYIQVVLIILSTLVMIAINEAIS